MLPLNTRRPDDTQGCKRPNSCLHDISLACKSKVALYVGVTVIGEVNQLTTHVMNVLWLLGTFTFATVIGIIGEDVTNTIMVPPRPCAICTDLLVTTSNK